MNAQNARVIETINEALTKNRRRIIERHAIEIVIIIVSLAMALVLVFHS